MLSFKKLSSIVPTKDRCPQGELYTEENVQPQSFQINCCVIAVLKKVRYALCPRRPMPYAHEYLIFRSKGYNIAIDHQRILLVPIVSNTTIGENNFIPIAHIEV